MYKHWATCFATRLKSLFVSIRQRLNVSISCRLHSSSNTMHSIRKLSAKEEHVCASNLGCHVITINTLDCDQSNYSTRIVFSHIPIEFGQTGISAIRSTDPKNPILEPNMKWIGQPLAKIWPFEIFPYVRSVVGRSSVGRSSIYTSSYSDLVYSSSLH